MNLTKDNYFGYPAMKEYMSVSQFKTFLECPERMLAEQIGEYERPKSKDLLMGSYVDAYFSGEMEDFVEQTPELFRRDGGLKAEFMQCNRIIARAKEDPFFMSYLDAPVKQQILTGEICGHPWKIKVDALHEDKIVDLKVMKSFDPVWKDGERKPWPDAWCYPLQGYVYREIVRQHTGKVLPFFLAAITKEDVPDLEVIEIPGWRLDQEKAVIEHYIEEYAAVKAEQVPYPRRCGRCAWCKSIKKLERVKGYEELLTEMEVSR